AMPHDFISRNQTRAADRHPVDVEPLDASAQIQAGDRKAGEQDQATHRHGGETKPAPVHDPPSRVAMIWRAASLRSPAPSVMQTSPGRSADITSSTTVSRCGR